MNPERDEMQRLALWEVPVYVRIGRGMTETIDGPQEALTYLLSRWPAERGYHYRQAIAVCTETIEEYGSLEEAREAFVAAAVEVHILA